MTICCALRRVARPDSSRRPGVDHQLELRRPSHQRPVAPILALTPQTHHRAAGAWCGACMRCPSRVHDVRRDGRACRARMRSLTSAAPATRGGDRQPAFRPARQHQPAARGADSGLNRGRSRSFGVSVVSARVPVAPTSRRRGHRSAAGNPSAPSHQRSAPAFADARWGK